MNNDLENLNNRTILQGIIDSDPEFLPVLSIDEEDQTEDFKFSEVLPILPLRNTVLFPGVVLPITIGREKSIELIKKTYKKDKIIGTVTQIDGAIEEPEISDLHKVGTVAKIIKIFEMPDGVTTAIIQGKQRMKIGEFVSTEPYFKAKTTALMDIKPKKKDEEFDAIVSSIKDLSLQVINQSREIPQEAAFAIKNIENPRFLINFICSNSPVQVPEKQQLLEISDLKLRATKLMDFLTQTSKLIELKNEVQSKVKVEMDKQQREYFLHQQMKTIKDELGENPVDQDIKELVDKGKTKKWSKDVEELFAKQIEKLQRINPMAPDYSIQVNYLQTILDLPWEEYTKDNFDLNQAQKVLDFDHFGLTKVKDRILEYIAVLKLKGDLKSPILCLVGPPGVGKTSLGKSVARAIGRNYIRMSLGGLHDEAEIRGHRKTYIGALPGRIIQNIKKAGSSNPVFILDEIDKVGNDFRGDPSSALLEVLDPEQNNSFYDNYLEFEYDLSKVMFIATANTTASINPALLDRMEIIHVDGYTVEEKVEIANNHLVPKQLKEHGVKKSQLRMSKKIIEKVISDYTRESGVRALDKKIAKLVRGQAKKIAFNEDFSKSLNQKSLEEILGPPQFFNDAYKDFKIPGIVTGLAWTAVGGQILFVESSLSQGKGKLTLTGNLGDVMKESAVIALEYIKSISEKLDISEVNYDEKNIHVHVPEGAIPKDGPSAGITMLTSLASVLTNRLVKKNLAMTGEVTLSGRVLPVGGIKEKILAARRAKITNIILSRKNEKDLVEIDDVYKADLSFHFVDTANEVLELALEK